jgi:tetrapyrrole methylase family protein/MazG family protein
MTGITIIGLGNNRQASFSNEAQQFLKTAQRIYLKSPNGSIDTLKQIPTSTSINYVSPRIKVVDGLTDGYQALTQALIEATPIVYAVPGDPLIDEASTSIIRQAATQANIPVAVLPGEAILPQTLKALQISPGMGVQIFDATLLASYHHPPLEPHRPVLITGLYHPDLVAPLIKVLQTIYAPQVVIKGLTVAGPIETTLAELSASLSQIFIPAQPHSLGLTRFQETIAHLRAPDGCPWDKEQTHHTLRPYLLEETYEVLAALDSGDMADLAEELGDLLLQIILHAQIATEAGTFRMTDVINQINQKIIRRHPHVFGNISVHGSDEVKVNWEAIKAQEKTEKGKPETLPSAMDGVQLAMPALAQTLDISQKAVKVGFEWDDVQGVLRKLIEEAHEIATASTPAEVEAEIGDFLFTAVNLARKLQVDAETALRTCNARFMRRFRRLEALAHEQNFVLTELDKRTWFELWQQAKQDVAHLENKSSP